MNYDCLTRTRGVADVGLHWDSNTLVWGDGGAVIDELFRPGFTDATTPGGIAGAGPLGPN